MEPPRPPPAKKKRDGCLIALALFVGLALVVAGLGAFAIYRATSTKEGKTALTGLTKGLKLVMDARSAKGVRELQRLGCQQAMVLDVDKLGAFDSLFGETDAGPRTKTPFSVVVTCQGGWVREPPTCEDVATTYVDAAGEPSGEFAVVVTKPLSGAVCQTMHRQDGAKIGDLNGRSKSR